MNADLVIQVLGPAGVCVAILGAAVKVLLGMLADEKKSREEWTERTVEAVNKLADYTEKQTEQRAKEQGDRDRQHAEIIRNLEQIQQLGGAKP